MSIPDTSRIVRTSACVELRFVREEAELIPRSCVPFAPQFFGSQRYGRGEPSCLDSLWTVGCLTISDGTERRSSILENGLAVAHAERSRTGKACL